MITINELSQLLDVKIQENEFEIRSANKELQELTAKSKSWSDSNFKDAAKIMILKDKIVFHKAAILVLQDVKSELEINE